MYNGIAEQGNQLALNVEQFFRNSDSFEVGKLVGEMVATGVEDAVIFKGAGIACSFVRATTINGFTKLVKAGNASKAAQVARKIGKQTGQKFKRVVRAAQVLGEDVAIAVTPEGLHIPLFNIMEAPTERLVRAFPNTSSTIIEEMRQLAELAISPAELEVIQTKYFQTIKGFGPSEGKWIKINWDHIFSPDFVMTKKGPKLTGFHFDCLERIEKSGIIEFKNKIIDKHGVIKTDLWWNGRRIPEKTFFPSGYTYEQGAEKIVEALNNFKKSYGTGENIAELMNKRLYEIQNSNMIRFVGKTKEGIPIEFLKTCKGEIKTSYPKYLLK